MTVSSGQRDYQYSRYPFELQPNEVIGLSGILFEEIAFAILAEQDIYRSLATSGNEDAFGYYNRQFSKFINSQIPSGQYEPKSDGSNLDGTNTNLNPVDGFSGIYATSACVNFANTIEELRQRLSGIYAEHQYNDPAWYGLLFSISHDSPSHIQSAWDDYFQNQLGHLTTQWTYGDISEESGIHDIDIRELQFKPFSRLGPVYTPRSFSNTLAYMLPDVGTPLIPSAVTRDGKPPKAYEQDKTWLYRQDPNDAFGNLVGSIEWYDDRTYYEDYEFEVVPSGIWASGVDACQSGLIFVAGDLFTSGSLLFTGNKILGDTIEHTSSGTCEAIYSRTGWWLNRGFPSGFGLFDLSDMANHTMPSGLYRVTLVESGMGTRASGHLSHYPSRETDLEEEWGSGLAYQHGSNDVERCSGLHVIDDVFQQKNNYGKIKISPLNGAQVWCNFVDYSDKDVKYQTNGNFGEFGWSNLPPEGYNRATNHALGIEVNTSGTGGFPNVYNFYGMAVPLDMGHCVAGSPTYFTPAELRNAVGDFATEPDGWAIYVEDHQPASGQNVQGYYLINTRYGNNVTFYNSRIHQVLFDGTDIRGTIILSTQSETGTPHIFGTINGHLYGGLIYKTYSSTSPWKFYHYEIRKTPLAPYGWPPPVASGLRVATSGFQEYNVRPLVYSADIEPHFRQMNRLNCKFDGPNSRFPRLFLPSGSFGYDDGSTLLDFRAVIHSGETLRCIGRVVEATSGSEDQLQIVEVWSGIYNWNALDRNDTDEMVYGCGRLDT